MRKKALTAFLAVLVLALTGLLGWPHFKTWQFRRVLDSGIFPQVQESVRKMGWGQARTSYRTAEAKGADFIVTGLVLAVEGWPNFELKADKLTLRRLNMDWSGSVSGFDCLCEGVLWSGPFGQLALSEMTLEGISPMDDWRVVAIGRYLLQGISLRGGSEETPAGLGSLEGRACRLRQEPGGGGFVVSQGPVMLTADGFNLRVGQAVFTGGSGSGQAWARSSARLDLSDLSASPGARGVTLEKVSIAATAGETAMRARVAIGGLVVQTQSLAYPEAGAELEKLGYDALKVEAALAYRFERERSLLAIEELSLEVKDAGRIKASLELGGVKRDLVNNPGQDLDWLKDCHLKGLRMSYHDHSLADRIMARLAEERGIPLPLFKELAILGLEVKGRWQGIYLGALPGFIRRPRSLCAEARPRRELTLGQAPRLALEELANAWDVKLLSCP